MAMGETPFKQTHFVHNYNCEKHKLKIIYFTKGNSPQLKESINLCYKHFE